MPPAVAPDSQIEFWMAVGMLLVVAGAFALFFYGWPSGGDPSDNRRPGGGGPDDGGGV